MKSVGLPKAKQLLQSFGLGVVLMLIRNAGSEFPLKFRARAYFVSAGVIVAGPSPTISSTASSSFAPS
jgi:hypothetical protein